MTFFDVLSHLFTPRESNNHRPKILHPNIFLLYIVLFVFIGTGFRLAHKYAPNILGVATNISITDLLADTNQKRIEAGLEPLSLNQELSQAASLKAADMFKDNYWAHYGPNGKSPWDFIISSGYNYTLAGENLAKDFDNSQNVVNAWIASPSHKDNILKPEYKDIGFAVVNGVLNGEETTLVVQMFGKSSKASSPNISITPLVNQQPSSNTIVAGIKTSPVVNLAKINKSLSLFLLGLLTIVLTLDGFLIWQRKTIRVSGHNIAHVIFFAALITVIWLTTSGSII